jgi:hypothetical protein
VTLDDILTRQRVELASSCTVVDVVDSTQGRATLTSSKRPDTLDVAKRLAEKGRGGIKYCLSKHLTANGFALFGPKGAHDLEDPDAGSWKENAVVPALQDPELLATLEWRDCHDKQLPIILKRFPPTPEWLIRSSPKSSSPPTSAALPQS